MSTTISIWCDIHGSNIFRHVLNYFLKYMLRIGLVPLFLHHSSWFFLFHILFIANIHSQKNSGWNDKAAREMSVHVNEYVVLLSSKWVLANRICMDKWRWTCLTPIKWDYVSDVLTLSPLDWKQCKNKRGYLGGSASSGCNRLMYATSTR